MSDYILSSESTADITKEHFDRIGVECIYFHYTLDGNEHVDDLGQSMSYDEFYNRLLNGEEPKSAQINVQEYSEFFEGFLKEGKDVLHVAFSSGLSGSCNAATIAADALKDKYPDRKIYVVDSLCASAGQGLLVDEAADRKASGMTIDDLKAWVEANRLRVNHWFFTTDLTFFIKGGRVSKAAGIAGGVLKICPVLNVSNEGKLVARNKVRGKKKAETAVLNKMLALADHGNLYDGKCYISHSHCIEDAMELKSMVEEKLPYIKDGIEIDDIGTTIGCHTGVGTVALFFFGKKRED